MCVCEIWSSTKMNTWFSDINDEKCINGLFGNSCLSAYRRGYNCQNAILRLTEYWRQALDGGCFVGTVAMDLSKAFDRMTHGLLIAKLHAYDLSMNACHLIVSYLKDRHQRVKVMGECSDWATVNRGVPQGSVMGPLLYNVFLNDLFKDTLHPVHMRQPVVAVGTKHCQPVDEVVAKNFIAIFVFPGFPTEISPVIWPS